MAIWPFAELFEKKSLSEPTETELAIFTGSTLTIGGLPIESSPAAACVTLISGAVSSLDLCVERRNAKREQVNHPSLTLLQGQVNPWLDGPQFLRDLMSQALTSDAGGLAYVVRNSEGKPVEIIRYDTGRMTYQRDPNGSGEPVYRINGNLVDMADVIHIQASFSRCPMSLAADAIQTDLAIRKYARQLFSKGAKPGGALEIPSTIGEEGIKRLKAGWAAANEGPDNAGKTAVLFGGAKFAPFTMSSVDAQLLELRKFAVEEIARYFNLAPSMVGDQTKSSYSKGSQSQLEALVFAIEPWLFAIEGALNRALLSDDERKSLTFKFQRDDLTRASLTERANAINSLRASGVLSANEGRNWLGLPDREGGDTFENPNITPAVTVPDAGANNGGA